MNEYLNISFLVPGVFGVLSAGILGDVVRRMTNLSLPWWARFAVLCWSGCILAMAGYDIYQIHYYRTQEEAVFVVVLKCLLYCGAAGAGVAGNFLLAKSYPLRMAASRYEPSPKAICFVDASNPHEPLAGMIRDQFVTLVPAR